MIVLRMICEKTRKAAFANNLMVTLDHTVLPSNLAVSVE